MKAPDKIYIHRAPHLGFWSATEIPVDAPDETVYIRKDALLEWAKKQIETPSGSDFQDGQNDSWERLINKLNSL